MSMFSGDNQTSEFTPLHNARTPSHSFLDSAIGSFRGPNSISNFASSFARAQSFAASKIDNEIHKKRSFFTTPPSGDEHAIEDETFDPELMVPSQRGERLSVIINELSNRPQWTGAGSPAIIGSSNDVFYHDDVLNALQETRSRKGSSSGFTPGQSTALGYGGYGIIPRKHSNQDRSLSISSVRTSLSILTTPPHFNFKQIEDKEGNTVTILSGQSTAPQTIFNSVNVLIGVGLLALPVGILKAGWILGVPYLIICGVITCWTAGLISKAMDTDNTIMTYSDLGYASYGSLAKAVISVIFCIDLLGAGVSLIVLLSDSLFALLGDDISWTGQRFKLISFFILTPFTFLPLPILSLFSLVGIMATFSVTILVFACGLIKSTLPGSLINIMPVNMWPQSIPDLFLAIGIILAPFGGHAIFPNLKSDMRHPHKFMSTLKVTYATSLFTDATMGVLGFLMFGIYCNNEITNNILLTPGYPKWIYPLISGFICLIPLAKTSLNARPIISTLDSILGVDKPMESFLPSLLKAVVQFGTKVGVNALFVFLAIMFPEFDRIVGMMGASICFLVCIILPGIFYLKLCGNSAPRLEIIMVVLAIVVSLVLSSLGTWAVFRA